MWESPAALSSWNQSIRCYGVLMLVRISFGSLFLQLPLDHLLKRKPLYIWSDSNWILYKLIDFGAWGLIWMFSHGIYPQNLNNTSLQDSGSYRFIVYWHLRFYYTRCLPFQFLKHSSIFATAIFRWSFQFLLRLSLTIFQHEISYQPVIFIFGTSWLNSQCTSHISWR